MHSPEGWQILRADDLAHRNSSPPTIDIAVTAQQISNDKTTNNGRLRHTSKGNFDDDDDDDDDDNDWLEKLRNMFIVCNNYNLTMGLCNENGSLDKRKP